MTPELKEAILWCHAHGVQHLRLPDGTSFELLPGWQPPVAARAPEPETGTFAGEPPTASNDYDEIDEELGFDFSKFNK